VLKRDVKLQLTIYAICEHSNVMYCMVIKHVWYWQQHSTPLD